MAFVQVVDSFPFLVVFVINVYSVRDQQLGYFDHLIAVRVPTQIDKSVVSFATALVIYIKIFLLNQ